jgi:predicted RNA polymerase sigma factor
MPDELCVTDDISGLRAEVYVARQASEQTIARIDALLVRFPESPELWVMRGDALRLLENEVDARTSYERALAVSPGNALALEALTKG